MIKSLPILPGVARCCGCEACASTCSAGAISMIPDSEGFLHPSICDVACVGCKACERVCPELNKFPPRMSFAECGWQEPGARVYAAQTKDLAVRRTSTSGGLFTALSRKVLADGGVVFGVVCDLPSGDVHFTSARTVAELEPLRKSKYVQASINGAYREIGRCLKDGKQVLFCGTPCQVAGLKHYLGCDYGNLLLVDIVCHGVPSSLVWKKFLASQQVNVSSVEFRSKSRGWNSLSMSMVSTDGKELCSHRKGYAYLWGFGQDLYNRHSCEKCSFRLSSCGSDLTLGDFWGIGNKYPEMDDNTGTSLVIVHSEKGKLAFGAISGDIVACKCLLSDAVAGNPSLVSDSKSHKCRSEFWERINRGEDFVRVVKSVLRMGFWQRVMKRVSH